MKITFLKVSYRYTVKLLKYVFLETLFSITAFLFFLTPWLVDNFGDSLSIDQIIVSFTTRNEGLNQTILDQLQKTFVNNVATPSLLLNLFFLLALFIDKIVLFQTLANILSFQSWLRSLTKILFFAKRHLLTIVFLILIYSCYQVHNNISGFGFIAAFSQKFSQQFEKFNVKKTKISFGDKKRNLIFIFLESMEATFQDKDIFHEDLMFNLTSLQKSNYYVKDHPQTVGSHYTMGALVSYLCALPPQSFGEKNNKELNKTRCLTDILAKNGYNQFFLRGANASYAGFRTFARKHHLADKFAGFEELKAIDPDWNKHDSHIGWGISDSRIYHHAKIKINELSKKDAPFAFMILTADSHFPTGFVDPSCDKKYQDYRDVVLCADKQVYNFVKWIKNQKFAKDTTIVIVSDHLFMGGPIHKDYLRFNKEKRRNYNVIINPIDELKTDNRTIAHVDFLPTVIEALGGNIKGGRLGLGTSLFSDKETYIEKLGKHEMDSLLFYYCTKEAESIKGKTMALHGEHQ